MVCGVTMLRPLRKMTMGLVLAACTNEGLPPHGEALVVVDTNAPVPRVVSRLRIDVYADDGTWIASRDDLRPDPRDWPTTFSVGTEATSRAAWIRLRAYPEGRRARYSGHIHASFAELYLKRPEGNGEPRLWRDGEDRTPEFEPDPAVTIDRLVRLRLAEGERVTARVLLSGACTGTMPRLTPWRAAETCVEKAGILEQVREVETERGIIKDGNTRVAAWGDEPCPEAAQNDRICVPGGAFVFGDRFYGDPARDQVGTPLAERVTRVSRFFIDRTEFTVARYRRLLASGFAPPVPVGTYEKDDIGRDPVKGCTLSEAPRGREDAPLSCVPWETARAACEHEGGDLPTEAQWEYAALAAGRPQKTLYPWGDDEPSCTRVVYGRAGFADECKSLGSDLTVTVSRGDRNPLGILDLTGSMSEHMRDTLLPFSDPCWTGAPLDNPTCLLPPLSGCPNVANPACLDDPGLVHGLRGGSWLDSAADLRIVSRQHGHRRGRPATTIEGFRCVYPAN